MNYYEELVKIITSKDKFLIKLGLERISRVMELFGNPQNSPKIIHISGTNGKGSTAAIIAKILEEAGYKTGLYTSPHISKYNERIKINGKDIEDKIFFDLLDEVLAVCTANKLQLSEFELLTAVAFLYFNQENVDFLVLETGLGGRLDATNIVQEPLLTVITSISLDHTDRLGNTIEKIAYEKAGIIKENRPTIISKKNVGYKIIHEIAQEKNSKIISPSSKISVMPDVNNNTATINGETFEFSLLGEYQEKNLALAIEAINFVRSEGFEVSKTALRTALTKIKHPARFEYVQELGLLIDGAHNPDGAISLRKSLDVYFNEAKKCFIYASINTKDFENCIKNVVKNDDELYLYDFKRENAVGTEEIKSLFPKAHKIDSSSILELIENNHANKILTIITGSLYAIGDLHALITHGVKYSPVG